MQGTGKRRVKNLYSKTEVDLETGELTTTEIEKHYSVRINSENFYMTFIDCMSGFFKISSITDIKLLAKMCTLAEFNTGKVLIPTSLRKEIEKEFDISAQTLTNSISRLRQLRLIRGEKGSFQINEQVFWKGDMKTRAELIKEHSNLNFKIDLK